MDDVTQELIEMARADQAYRSQWFEKRDDPEYIAGRQRIDKAHAARLQEIMRTYGWPSKKQVGAEASHAAWILVQHADLEFQDYCLKLLDNLSAEENDPRQRAYLIDKIRLRRDQPQLYGTQYVKQDDDLVLYDVEDPEELDERRRQVGLPPASYHYDFEAAKRADENGTAFSSLGGWASE